MVAAISLPEREWLVRQLVESDVDTIHDLLASSYTRSRAGQRANASKGAGSNPTKEAREAFCAAHAPVWSWLLEHADVTLAVDPDAPHQIWAWLITSPPNVIHAIGCKQSLVDAQLSTEVVRDLLGERLAGHSVCSLELPQMRSRGPIAIGLDRPKEWSIDPTWLITRMRP